MAYTTHKTLIEAICSGDNDIDWDKFHRTYRPLIIACGRKSNLSELYLDELVSDVMTKFYNNRKSFIYNREKGKFRSYLYKVAKNATIDLLRKINKNRDVIGEFNEQIYSVEEDVFDEVWNEEWYAHLQMQALAYLKMNTEEKTFDIFYRYVIEQESVSSIAELYKCNNQAVYDIKNRLLKRMKLFIVNIQEE